MNTKKRILLLSLVVCILVAAVCFLIFAQKKSPAEEPLAFSERILQENFTGMTLTIYYMYPGILTRAPLTPQQLIDSVLQEDYPESGKVITIGAKELLQNKDLLKKMIQTELTPVEDNPKHDARIYIRFDSEKYGKLYDVVMWGIGESKDKCIFVCDEPVQEEAVFYELIAKFAPEVGYTEIQNYVDQ